MKTNTSIFDWMAVNAYMVEPDTGCHDYMAEYLAKSQPMTEEEETEYHASLWAPNEIEYKHVVELLDEWEEYPHVDEPLPYETIELGYN